MRGRRGHLVGVLVGSLLAGCAEETPRVHREDRPKHEEAPPPLPDPSSVNLGPRLPGAQQVSLARILADAAALHGQPVVVGGYVHIEFEGHLLCLNRDDFEHSVQTNCVWLEVDGRDPALQALSDRYVVLEGIVNKDGRGHLSSRYPARIESIRMIHALAKRQRKP